VAGRIDLNAIPVDQPVHLKIAVEIRSVDLVAEFKSGKMDLCCF
jgi:hypothetical protein